MTRPLRVLAAIGVLTALATGWAAPAQAHEGEGTIEVLAADPAAPLEVAYRVRLRWNNDGHPAADATVTVVAERAGAPPTTPQPMAATGEEGAYAATVRFPEPGDWTVRFTAVTPRATLERAQAVAPPPSTTTTSAPETTTTASTEPSPSTPAADDAGADRAVPLAVIAATAVLVALGVVAARRRRR